LNNKTYKNILLVRTDRIGDVILSLPAAALLKDLYPGCRITFLAREYTAPLIALSKPVDAVINDDPILNARGLAKILKAHDFDLAVLLHPTGRLAWALRLAGIPVRIGTAYRSYSLLFNRRVKQHRKFSLKHELEHNLELVRSGLGLASGDGKEYLPELVIAPDLKERVTRKLSGIIDTNQPFMVIHPGSGGSARDWPLKCFAELADRIINSKLQIQNLNVAVTLGPGEEHIKEKLQSHLKTQPAWVSGLSLPELAAFLSQAELMAANSTGPLHIATAAGTKVIGLYCPMIPCHPKRWGPYGPGHTAIVPDASLCRKCIPSKCNEYDCMEKITVDEVYFKISRSLTENNNTE
jgi:ADP-heptose:LPS heptosyltransferase